MSNHALYTSFNRVLKLAEKICPVQPLIVREGKKIGDRFLEDSLNVIIAKFVVSRCAFCTFLGFSVPPIILADLLRNSCSLAQVQKVMVCDS